VNVARDAGLTDHASAGIASIALGSALAGGGSLRRAEAAAVEGERLRRYPEPEAGHLHALLSLAAIRAQRGAFAPARSHLEEVERGLTVFDDAGRLPELASMVRALLREREASATPVADHLTPAELQVLELFRQELSLSEIAARLFVSRNTVKTHTRTLYRKLNVSSRDEAVVRATALGLLTPDDSPG
jgi:LuxR family maltose regulon positive regulatory protein